MITVAKDVKQHSLGISNIEEAKIIAARYATVKNYVFSRYSGINSLNILNIHRTEIRNKWVQSKFAEQWKLPARYWKNALDEAISNIKTEWSNTKNRVKERVKINPNLTDDEKKFIYYILKANSILQSILTYKSFDKPEKIDNLNIREKYIYNLIRRYVRKYKGTIPVSKKKRSFMIDVPMYNYKTVYGQNIIEITGLKKNSRIDIILKDKNIHTGNLRVVIENGNSIVIHRLKKVAAEENTNSKYTIGIDKGYTSLFAVNSGNFYGEKLNEFLNKETERLNAKNAKRNKVWTLMDKYIKAGNLEKAERIRKNNFGKIKYNKQKHRFDEQVKSYINHEIRFMYDIEIPTEIVTENLNFQSWVKKIPKKIKRKLSRWIKGYIQKRLEYIASLRQIKVTMINPAYTSQVCHKCGAFGHRSGKTFTCPNCGTMDADYNASCNIKARKDDTEIILYTPYKNVKQILLNRYKLNLNLN